MAFIILAACTLVALCFHELGHVLTARICGIEIECVSIGLGPELTAFTDRRGTRWRFALWPVGAYTIYQRDGTRHQIDSSPLPSRFAAAAVLAAGSLSNLMLSISVLLLVSISGYPMSGDIALTEPLQGAALLLSGLSFVMAVFNLIPAPPLDG